MGKITGFMEYERCDGEVIEEAERIGNFEEFHILLPKKEQEIQGARCMDCGVPFCQSGMMIEGMLSGCPLHNLIPEINDLVYRGRWVQAYTRLSKTHVFPEFTGRVCPALCEKACTCGLHNAPVSTKENENAVIEYAFSHGLVKEPRPKVRTGKKIAVIGSGPSGLAAAAVLNRRGHKVTVFERNRTPGGLLRYGIPNMKLDKRIIDRRISLMQNAGVEFRCGIDVGKDIRAEEIKKEFDRIILCCGASLPRDINAPGRDAKGICFAVPFLSEVTEKLMLMNYDSDALIENQKFSFGKIKGKKVVVIGGGDTGNDCVGTCVRLGAAAVTQLEMMPEPPVERLDSNPWPEWPRILKTDYGQEEAAFVFGADPRVYQTTVTEYIKDKRGKLKSVKTVKLESSFDKKAGRMVMNPIPGSEKEIKADLVLIAAGFLGAESYIADEFETQRTARGNVKTADGEYGTSVENVFTAGDMHLGQSLVVRAIAEGLAAARAVDKSLMGYSNL